MIGVISDIGVVRSLNEDYALYYEGKGYSVYVVADGMGGHNAGEVASKMAAEGIIEFIKNNFNNENSGENEKLLEKAIKDVNNKIFIESLKIKDLTGMGTTVTVCFLTKDFTQVGNVGDSCCFGLNSELVEKITKDHSLVQELLDAGSISEEQAFHHPKKNIITRAIGTNTDVLVDIFNIQMGKYRCFLLCSDGLANEVLKEEILDIVKNENSFDLACEKLVHLAKVRGGRDNITVLLFGGEI